MDSIVAIMPAQPRLETGEDGFAGHMPIRL